MYKSNSFIVAKEGFKIISITALIVSIIILFSESFFLTLLSLLFFAAIIFLFKNPERVIQRFEPLAIMSICDGVISSIENLQNSGEIEDKCIKITISNKLWDTSILRVPFDCTFVYNEIQRGAQLASSSSKATSLNEQAEIMFQKNEQKEHKVVIKHYLNGLNLPLNFYPKITEKVSMGSRYGFMLQGTIIIFLPALTKLNVQEGETLRAGESTIGFFANI